jgi:hypothetical protein
MIRTYESMQYIGTDLFNDKNYCGVIATATACKVSFGKAHSLFKKVGRKNRVGTNMRMYEDVYFKLGYNLRVEKGWQLKNSWSELGTTRDVAKRYPKGVWLVQTRKHIFCIVNGKINDWNENKKAGHGSMSKIYSILEVTKV